MDQNRLNAITNNIKNNIKTVPDYPKAGIMFRDVTSLMQDGEAFAQVIDLLKAQYSDKGITTIVGTEARGFIFGAPLAYALGISFVPVRKPGKLPREVLSQDYDLEYGKDTLQIHFDAIKENDSVLLVDDLLATGGTMDATAHLVRQLGGKVYGAAFVVSLPELGGEARLAKLDVDVSTLVSFEGE
ncbi:MAG: adenine phosphoribosyltransferase [Alteromonadaceae bacterium]|jgi:adenine phosphoribosyltransferase